MTDDVPSDPYIVHMRTSDVITSLLCMTSLGHKHELCCENSRGGSRH